MTAERAHAYGELIRMIDGLGPAALHPAEQRLLRDAADDLVLSDDGESWKLPLARADELLDSLASSGRWPSFRVERLGCLLTRCAGPTVHGSRGVGRIARFLAG